MKVKPGLFSILKNLDSAVAASAGFALILIFSSHSGIGISPDSVAYLSTARHIIDGHGFIAFDNRPTVDFPVGYPLFLASLSMITRLDPLVFAPVVNALLFGILLYVSGAIMNGFYKSSGWYKRVLLLALLLSPALQEVYSMLWSETLFLVLILFFILTMTRYLDKSHVKWLFISAALCAFASVTRYAAIFLLFTGLCLIVSQTGITLWKRARHALMYGLISISLLSVNLIRNYHLTGLPAGQRPKSETGIRNILEFFGTVLRDALDLSKKPGIAIFLTVGVIVVFLLSAYRSRKRMSVPCTIEYVISVTGLVYCVFMISTSALIRYEAFTNRLLSPMFIPLLWATSAWIPGWLSARAYRIRWAVTGIILVFAAIFLNTALRQDYDFYDGVKYAGIPDYGEDPFVKSAIVQFLKKNPDAFPHGSRIYSNAADAFYFITGMPATQVPIRAFPEKLNGYYRLPHGQPEFLIWFYDLDNLEMPDLETILRHKDMRLLNAFPDGVVFQSK